MRCFRLLAGICVLLSAVFVFSSTTWAIPSPFAGGSGTQEDPWQIATPAQLNAVRDYLSDYFILVNDIDLNVSPYNQNAGWSPIGTNSLRFMGSFDGNGHVISNLFISRSGNNEVGLFGFTQGAIIRDLGLVSVNVQGRSNVGALVGAEDQGVDAAIINAHVTGVVVGNGVQIGGLAGYYEGMISGSHSEAYVVGTDWVGGLVGMHVGAITGSRAEGNVQGRDFVGGLVGEAYSAIIASYATGNVNGRNCIGGLVGQSYADITESYSTGSVIGDDSIGGLVGYLNAANINRSFATGDIEGINEVGGLVGFLRGNSEALLTDVYANGTVTAEAHYVGGLVGEGTNATITNAYAVGPVIGFGNVGGLVGMPFNLVVINSYFNSDTTSLNDSNKGEPKTTVELQQQITFSSWDFMDVWSINEGEGYPYLSWQSSPFAGGQGTLQDPYQIATAEQLAAMSDYLDSHFVLVNDIDLSDFGQWEPIGIYVSWENSANEPFTGSLDGAGFTISGLFINQPDLQDAGLFGLTDGASIENINLADVNITGRTAGGLIGWAYATTVNSVVTSGEVAALTRAGGLMGEVLEGTNISASSSSCTVSTTNGTNAGGLVGQMRGTTINRSYATGDVSTGLQDLAGGLVGEASYNSLIQNSYATGNVSGESEIGGLTGYLAHDSRIENSYATGLVDGANSWRVGGLVGHIYSNSTIARSYASGQVIGGNEVGGLVGSVDDVTSSIIDSFAVGEVTASENVGGLAGKNLGRIERTYSTGAVITRNGVDTMGGLIGSNEGLGWNDGVHGTIVGDVRDSYWDTEASGLDFSAAGEERTTAELQQQTTFTGWAIVADATIDQGSPLLTWQVSQNYSGDPAWVIGTGLSVTPDAGAGGSISPGSVQSISNGATTSFTIIPDDGYAIAGVTGCGGSLLGNIYTTAAITQACNVIATFQLTAVDPVDPDPTDPILPVLIEKDYIDAPQIVASHRLTRRDPQSGAVLSITRAHSEVPNSTTLVNDETSRVVTTADIETEGRKITLQAESYGDGRAVHRVILINEGEENNISTQALSRFTGAFTLMEEGRITTWVPLLPINGHQWRAVVETRPDGESRLWYEVCEIQCDNELNWILSSVTLPGDQAFEAGNEIEVEEDLLDGVQMRIKTHVTREIRF